MMEPCFVSFAALHAALTKTEWFEGGQLPARSGVYEISRPPPHTVYTEQRSQARPVFRYFDGERWYYGDDTPAKAMYTFQALGIVQNDFPRWRGLTKEAHDAPFALLPSAI